MTAPERDERLAAAVLALGPYRERAAWRESWRGAAEYVNRAGMPACVPCSLLGWLRSLGISAWCSPDSERAA